MSSHATLQILNCLYYFQLNAWFRTRHFYYNMPTFHDLQPSNDPASKWRLYNVAATSMQRHDVASTLRRRCINVVSRWGRSLGTLGRFFRHFIYGEQIRSIKAPFFRREENDLTELFSLNALRSRLIPALFSRECKEYCHSCGVLRKFLHVRREYVSPCKVADARQVMFFVFFF